MSWTVEYYKDTKGYEPVASFIDSMPEESQSILLRTVDLLSKYGVLLKEPYTRQVKGKIRELRIKGARGANRILYFTFTGKRFILLHGFLKKTDKTPPGEIAIAEKRMNDFIDRQGG